MRPGPCSSRIGSTSAPGRGSDGPMARTMHSLRLRAGDDASNQSIYCRQSLRETRGRCSQGPVEHHRLQLEGADVRPIATGRIRRCGVIEGARETGRAGRWSNYRSDRCSCLCRSPGCRAARRWFGLGRRCSSSRLDRASDQQATRPYRRCRCWRSGFRRENSSPRRRSCRSG